MSQYPNPISFALGVTLVGTLAFGCQFSPTEALHPNPINVLYGTLTVPTNTPLAITLDVRQLLGEVRKVQAVAPASSPSASTAGPVSQIQVTVSGGNLSSPYTVTVDPSQCVGGFATVTVPSVPGGSYKVVVNAMDMSGQRIAYQTMDNVAVIDGETTVVQMTCKPANGAIHIDWNCGAPCGEGPSPTPSVVPTPAPSVSSLPVAAAFVPSVGHVAIDPNRNFWVSDSTRGDFKKFDSSGVYLEKIKLSGWPAAAALAPNGNMWISKHQSHTIAIVNPVNNSVVKEFATGTNPTQIKFDADGNAWVVPTGFNVNAVYKYDTAGTLLGRFSVGKQPRSVSFDSTGNAWVTNSVDNTITKLTKAGAPVGVYYAGFSPDGAAFDSNGNIWITSVDSTYVSIMNQNGVIVETINMGARTNDILFDYSGSVWVASYYSDAVYKIGADRSITQFSVKSSDEQGPNSLVLDSNNQVWATTFYSGQLFKVN